MHLARVSRNNVLYIFCMVETVGIEPTVFLMSLIYSQLPSPLGTHLQIEFVSRRRIYRRFIQDLPAA